MTSLNNSSLINKLEEGRKTKVLFISNNSYWHYLQQVDKKYENFHVEICGENTPSGEIEKRIRENDCDFIVCYSTDFYNENKFLNMENIASKISEEFGKRISIGYSYVIKEEEREHPNIKEEIKFISIKDNNKEELTFGMGFFNPLDLTDITIETHEYFKSQKCLKK